MIFTLRQRHYIREIYFKRLFVQSCFRAFRITMREVGFQNYYEQKAVHLVIAAMNVCTTTKKVQFTICVNQESQGATWTQ